MAAVGLDALEVEPDEPIARDLAPLERGVNVGDRRLDEVELVILLAGLLELAPRREPDAAVGLLVPARRAAFAGVQTVVVVRAALNDERHEHQARHHQRHAEEPRNTTRTHTASNPK
jgi:hypothetical protein